MIELKIHNDGKGKHQSFEAWIDGFDCDRGYGRTQEGAIQDYKRKLLRYSEGVVMGQQKLELGIVNIIKVNGFGNPY